jgi:hypothetical protein
MERRIRSLEDRFRPSAAVMLNGMARIAAEGSGLDPDEVAREARAVLAEIGGRPLPLAETAARLGVDLAAVEREHAEILARWEAIG